MGRALLILLTLAFAAPAGARDASRLATSRLFVEQPVAGDAVGVRLIPAPHRLRRGQSVVVLVALPRSAPARALVVSAVPDGLAFEAADRRAELSVDGGRRFGSLSSLTAGGAQRSAVPAHVTHVRWRLESSGQVSSMIFRGRVR